MTDGWPLYESRLKGKLHVISKRYYGAALNNGISYTPGIYR